MSLFCHFGCHVAEPGEVYNSGFYFSRCTRCRQDMIRFGGAWQLVPKGHFVAWKSGPAAHSIEPDYSRFVPVVVRGTRLPALHAGRMMSAAA